ncbi:AB hydrolase-1 domain-containing protein [Mycena sanguinolenta]|uniref:AB hydrolase-1 domain-containing protein n=1 Tax=Mycena sanguinolenta TaxID=230812 RepID=A0A8H6YP95_9AGAR|nr:AB hydrolase-1 domain-containing protein [Mycena sanguinolenta]
MLPLLPIYPPPASTPTPNLRVVPRSFPDSRYTLNTHIVPAAYLRCTPLAESPPPAPAPQTASKAERRAKTAERVAWVIAQGERPQGRHERVLWCAVNRYTRKDATGGEGTGVTLFLAHANGFPKETWEAAILDLLAIPNGAIIDEIWAWEAVHHGASYQLNSKLPFCNVWADDARDVLNFLLHFLPSSISSELPTFLPRVAPEESALRKVRGFSERKLFAVGHSFGGCCCTWAALTHPRLFTSLMLVDPVINRFGTPTQDPNTMFLDGAVARRDTWPSREIAHKTFAANPFFAAWDPRVLDAYVAHGLVEAPDGSVQLAMPGLQEALVFEGTPSGAPVWDMLPTLDERIPLRWVVPGQPGEPEIGGPGATQERVWRRPANSSNIRIARAGHLITQQAPAELAREIAGMLQGRFTKVQAKL